MKKLVFLLLVGFSLNVYSIPLSNSNNSDFYYEIGGARSISVPPNVAMQTYKLSGALEFGLGYSCGNFDPTLGLANILNGIKGAGNSLINGAIGAVSAAIGSLPALIMQRIDPGLYDLFQNALIRAEAVLALANKTCEQYEEEINAGGNPYKDWTDLSKVIDWKVQMGSGGFGSSKTDVVQAKQTVQKKNGKDGLPWVGGPKAGGQNQPPIKAVFDVVKAGYNLFLNRQADDSSPASSSSSTPPPRLVEIWNKPDDVSTWATEVLGDVYIRTYNNSPIETIPGQGLTAKIEKHNLKLETELTDLVNGVNTTDLNNLSNVSSHDVLINQDVIEAIKSFGPSEQAIAVSKLASEAAMSQVLEKALMVRRLLITASREPNVSQTPAGGYIQESIEQLDRDIDNVLFERRIHVELASQTPSIILKLKAKRDNRALIQQEQAGNETKLIRDGAIK